MEGSSPLVAAASDGDRSGSEGEFTGANGAAVTDGEKHDEAPMEAAGAVGFSISRLDTLSALRLNRTRPAADTELRYLHLLWKPGELLQAGRSSPGKITSSRVRRLGRARRNMGPIGKDLYGVCMNIYMSYINVLYIYIYTYTDTHTHSGGQNY